MASVRPDVVLYGCTTAGFLSGPVGDEEMRKALADIVGAPSVTTASSMVDALRSADIERVAVVTPYLEASNRGLKDFLAAKGIEVAALDSFFFETTDQYDKVTEDEVYQLAAATGRDADADGLFIACTQLPTIGILGKLRESLQQPVLGAIEATVWNAKRAVQATL
jgi:maleate cis-trans isomerase